MFGLCTVAMVFGVIRAASDRQQFENQLTPAAEAATPAPADQSQPEKPAVNAPEATSEQPTPNSDQPAKEAESSRQAASNKPVPLFNGKDLQGWKAASEHFFSTAGKVSVEDGVLILDAGTPGTGVRIDQPTFPKMNYEVSLEAKRIDGSDFFCGMTFPVNDSYCTLILGGWGGNVIGLSNVDGQPAVENETTTAINFENGRWYAIRLQVAETGVKMWLDDKPTIELDSLDHQFDIWWEQEPMKPFGIATWYTKAGLRNIQLRRLPADAKQAPPSNQD